MLQVREPKSHFAFHFCTAACPALSPIPHGLPLSALIFRGLLSLQPVSLLNKPDLPTPPLKSSLRFPRVREEAEALGSLTAWPIHTSFTSQLHLTQAAIAVAPCRDGHCLAWGRASLLGLLPHLVLENHTDTASPSLTHPCRHFLTPNRVCVCFFSFHYSRNAKMCLFCFLCLGQDPAYSRCSINNKCLLNEQQKRSDFLSLKKHPEH